MRSLLRYIVCAGFVLAGLAFATEAQAAPSIRITPPPNGKFGVNQKFDIRVEFTGIVGTLSNVTISIDGAPQSVTLVNNAWTLRNVSYDEGNLVGVHTISASASDDTGTANASSTFEIVQQNGTRPKFKNIIVLLGDGMGAQHRTAARLVRFGATLGKTNGFLAMDRFPVTGMVMTPSLNSIITDSAPGMSNYVNGNKAQNNQEGVFPDNTSNAFDNPRIEYLGEFLHRRFGKSVGIVSTADLEDATPAANAVHTSNRGAGTGICDQYLDERNLPGGRGNGIDVLLGGGRRWFIPSGTFGSSRSNGTDYTLDPVTATALGVPAGALDPTRDLLADFVSAGFAYASNKTEMDSAAANPATKSLLGLFSYGNMNVAYDKIAERRGNPTVVNDYHAPNQPMLDEMTDAALKVLSRNPRGFYLMVEGAHIDKQSHAMDADRAIWDTIEFDYAVARCRAFADANPGTLVLVVADHECSGFSIIGSVDTAAVAALPPDNLNLNPTPAPARQTAVGVFDAAAFPVYTINPDGYPATADPARKVVIGFGGNADRYEGWLAKPLPIVDSLLPSDISGELGGKGYPAQPINRSESAFGFFIRGQIPGTQAVHTAGDIVLSAYATGTTGTTVSQLFNGYQDNTDVFFKMLKAAFGGY
jgi:alkaline phosphatase